MRHNIDALSFMLNSFNELVGNFGESSKTVEYFRNNTQGLVNIGQLSPDDCEIIFELIGMTKTNSIKWSYTKERISQYTFAINKLLPYRGNDVALRKGINCLTYKGSSLNSTVVSLLNETFGLNYVASSSYSSPSYYGGCDRPRRVQSC